MDDNKYDDQMNYIEEDNSKIYNKDGVFYNPAQKLNRDITLMVLDELLGNYINPKILFAMEATGVRGIRYSKNKPDATVILNDISVDAIENVKINLDLNNYSYKEHKSIDGLKELDQGIYLTNFDCITLMTANKNTFDAIDIDPYGSSSIFILHALRAIKHNGIISFSCTDKGSLTSFPDKCFTRYGSNINPRFCPESGIRVLLKCISQTAAMLEYSIEPLICISLDFYIRVIVKIIKRRPKTAIDNNSLFLMCKCENRKKVDNDLTTLNCDVCSSIMKLYGPYWSAPIHSKHFIASVLEKVDEGENPRLKGLLRLLNQEIDTPFSFNLHKIATKLSKSLVKTKTLLAVLANRGFDVSITHYSNKTIKTTATLNSIIEAIQYICNHDYMCKDEVNEYVEKLYENKFYIGLMESKMPPGAIKNSKSDD